MAANLLWRSFGDFIRFIRAITSRGPIILMCSDLTVKPEQVLALYCRRIRIEDGEKVELMVCNNGRWFGSSPT